jgi:hypothetical protein
LRLPFDKLREGHAEHLLLSLNSAGTPESPEDISSLLEIESEVEAVVPRPLEPALIIVGIVHLRNELALKTEGHSGILPHDGVELMSGAYQLGECKPERRELVRSSPRIVPFV